MLQMSFYNGTLDRRMLSLTVHVWSNQALPIPTFTVRPPAAFTAKAVPIEKEKALHIIENESCLDVDETDTEIVLNAYTSNDML